MQLKVEMPTFDSTIIVESLIDAQEFPGTSAAVYEGIASAKGTFQGLPVTATAWNEQALG
jgi:hypothetical protein